MKNVRIFINYQTTQEPWGGINSFFRNFIDYINKKNNEGIELVGSIDSDFDIMLVGASSGGVNIKIDPTDLEKAKQEKNFFLVHRLDGLRQFYNQQSDPSDLNQIKISKLADFIIFQSHYSLENFRFNGYCGNNYKIIYNGTNTDLFKNAKPKQVPNNPLKIISCNWSSNLNKGYEVISRFSSLPNVEMTFVGNWNLSVDSRNVKLMPPMKHADLANILSQNDVFLHAAKNDPCPNVVVEALASGLPILYHNSGGTPELAANYGMELSKDEREYSILVNSLIANYGKLTENIYRDRVNFSISSCCQKYLDSIILNWKRAKYL